MYRSFQKPFEANLEAIKPDLHRPPLMPLWRSLLKVSTAETPPILLLYVTLHPDSKHDETQAHQRAPTLLEEVNITHPKVFM